MPSQLCGLERIAGIPAMDWVPQYVFSVQGSIAATVLFPYA